MEISAIEVICFEIWQNFYVVVDLGSLWCPGSVDNSRKSNAREGGF